jgi:site-specific DNA-methyltransferase (adenine-specific)
LKHLLVRCDAIELGRHVRPRSAQLAYLDPPFGVGAAFGARGRDGGERAQGPVAYEDRWASVGAYVAWLEQRVVVVRDCLASDGTMWLHLDHRYVHEAKVLCDRVFGRKAFLGEIVWLTGNGTRGARRGPGMTHQTLLIYATGRDFIWNASDPTLREPFAPTSLDMHFARMDERGRRYRERIVGGRTYRYYADEGRARGSVWSDCPAMVANTPLRREATGYPTQKPRKLLERIVRASSLEQGLVLDPFCGSGTTLVAAAKLGRSFVGCDVGELALETSAQRLDAEGIRFDLRSDYNPHHERFRDGEPLSAVPETRGAVRGGDRRRTGRGAKDHVIARGRRPGSGRRSRSHGLGPSAGQRESHRVAPARLRGR